jgi:methyl-CpG-binding domain protein 4
MKVEVVKRLIQHDYVDSPWKVLACCILLNRTTRVQVRSILEEFFSRYTSPYKVLSANPVDIASLIQPLGLYNRRSVSIQKFCSDYVEKDWNDPRELYGIGEYGWEAWEIVVNKNYKIAPTDSVLRNYLTWVNS